ncbi:MAG: RNA polymerase sigma factor [Acidobacteriaceae bacterium]
MHCLEQAPSIAVEDRPEGFDPHSFDSLVRNYETRLLRVAYRITGQREDAEDVVQETFLRVYEKMGQFEGKSQLSSWVTRIVINRALDCLRKRHRVKFVSVDEELGDGEGSMFLDLPEWRPDPEQCYRDLQCQELLRSAIAEMPSTCREAFLLYQSEDKSLEEIARCLGVTLPAVKSRLLRAKRLLRKRLSKPAKATHTGDLDWLFPWPELAL